MPIKIHYIKPTGRSDLSKSKCYEHEKLNLNSEIFVGVKIKS